MILGTGLVLVATGVGWAIGQHRSMLGVRVVAWWVSRVILPLLRSPSWGRRAATIFVNNVSCLSLLLVAGLWHTLAIAAVAGLGLSLGIGLRCLSEDLDELTTSGPGPHWGLRIGIALNMLEPPAIIAALGLSLGQSVIPLSLQQTWEAFVIWIVPALLLAACGEALWLGSARPPDRPKDSVDGDAPPPEAEP